MESSKIKTHMQYLILVESGSCIWQCTFAAVVAAMVKVVLQWMDEQGLNEDIGFSVIGSIKSSWHSCC